MKKLYFILSVILVAAFALPTEAATKWTTYRVLLDPGHGGSDSGASGPSAPHEATLALRAGLSMRDRIQNELGGTVKMTRTSNTTVSLTTRREMKGSYDPYIFCSIHLNAFNKTAKGTETLYTNTVGNSSLLANKVQPQLISNFKQVSGFTPTNRGVKIQSLAVCRGYTGVPAVLTEGLFVDNSTEWTIINSESKEGFKRWVHGHLMGFYDRLVLLKSDLQKPTYGGSSSGGGTTTTDTTKPTISRCTTAGNSSTSFYAYAYASDNVGVTRVSFPTWTDANGQDDLIWHTGTKGSWTVGGQTYNWRYLVNTSDHKNEKGKYTVHVYAYDAAGNQVSAGTSYTFTPATITFSPSTVSLSAVYGASTQPYQDVKVTGTNLEADLVVASNSSGIVATTQSGWNARTGGTLRLTLNTNFSQGASAEPREGYVAVQSGGGTSLVRVEIPFAFTLTAQEVVVPDEDKPKLEASVSSINLEGVYGSTTQPFKDIVITAQNMETDLRVSSNSSGLVVATQSDWAGRSGGTLRVTLNTNFASGAGTFTDKYIAVESGSASLPGGITRIQIPASFTLAPAGSAEDTQKNPALIAGPTALVFNGEEGATIASQKITVTGTDLSAAPTVSGGTDNFVLSHSLGVTGGVINVTPKAGLAVGSHTSTITVAADGISKEVSLTANITAKSSSSTPDDPTTPDATYGSVKFFAQGGTLAAAPAADNAALWELFKPDYNAYYKLGRADQPIESVTTFAPNLMQDFMTNAASSWKWLGDYISAISAAKGITLAEEAQWRYAVSHFFNCTAERTSWPATVGFEAEGKPEAWIPAYIFGHAPTKANATFLGWHDNAQGTGLELTELPHSGNVYACWKSTAPSLSVNPSSLSFYGEEGKTIVPQVITVKGENLTAAPTGTALNNFEVQADLTTAGGTISIVPMASLAPGTYNETFTLSANGVSQTITLKAEIIAKLAADVTYGSVNFYLQGGKLDVPADNEALWTLFMPDYNTYYSATRAEQPITAVSTFMQYGKAMLTDEKSGWKWLGDYISAISAAKGITLVEEAQWRYAMQHFFNCSAARTDWPKTVSFEAEGKPEAWKPVYTFAHTPTKDGVAFIGWFDNPYTSGAVLTALPASGDVYACWSTGAAITVDALSLTFNGEPGKPIASQTVVVSTANLTAAPTVSALALFDVAADLTKDGGSLQITPKAGLASGKHIEILTLSADGVSKEISLTVEISETVSADATCGSVQFFYQGGTLDVPADNAALWELFKPDYKTYYSADRADQPMTAAATFMQYGKAMLTDEKSGWKWLGDYMIGNAPALASAEETGWRFTVQGFLNCYDEYVYGATDRTQHYACVGDWKTAGKPDAWKGSYIFAHKPTYSGHTFLGWFDNAEGTGSALTALPTSGIVYACWSSDVATGVEELTSETVVLPTMTGVSVSFEGTRQVAVYNVNGMMVTSGVATEQFSCDLETGMYIIRVNNEIFKFIR